MTNELLENTKPLSEYQDSLRACFDYSSDIIFILQEKELRMIYCNPSALKELQYQQNELLNRNFEELLCPAVFSTKLATQILNGISTQKIQCKLTRKDGSHLQTELKFINSFSHHNLVIAIANNSGIDKKANQERLLLEKQLQQAQKMEAVGQLTGGIAHDFNNILASVMGYTSLAMELNEEINHAKLNNYLTQVFSASLRARDLVEQMLAFSRNSDSKPIDLDIGAHTRQAVRMLKSVLPSSVNITLQIPQQLFLVHIDPVQLHQIIMNLCINARDAMRGKGNLEIKLSMEKVESVCTACQQAFSGDFVVLQITDNGKGISKEIISRVFEPFFTTKKVGRGSGMGLSMVHGIIHEHRGHIILHSKVGVKTRFKLLFPRVEQSKNFRIQSGKKRHILIIDDEITVTEYLRELFVTCGFIVTVETNSIAALKTYSDSPSTFDLVLTDQFMPTLSGADLSKKLLDINPHLPIVLCTGYANAISEDEAKTIGIKRYLFKPIDPNKLLIVVNELLSEGESQN